MQKNIVLFSLIVTIIIVLNCNLVYSEPIEDNIDENIKKENIGPYPTLDDLKKADLAAHYTDHGRALYYTDSQGNPWTATYIQAKGDVIADLHEDMAAEQKARATYEWLINLTDDHDIKDILKFLRQREVVHFQRFGEALMDVQDYIKY